MSAFLIGSRRSVERRVLSFRQPSQCLRPYIQPRLRPERCFYPHTQQYYTNSPSTFMRTKLHHTYQHLQSRHGSTQSPTPRAAGSTEPPPVYFSRPSPEKPKRGRRVFWAMLRYGFYISMALVGAVKGYLVVEPFQASDFRHGWERELYGLQETYINFHANRKGFRPRDPVSNDLLYLEDVDAYYKAYVEKKLNEDMLLRWLTWNNLPEEEVKQRHSEISAELARGNAQKQAGLVEFIPDEEMRRQVNILHKELSKQLTAEQYRAILAGPRGVGPSRMFSSKGPQYGLSYTKLLFLGDRVCGWPGVVHGGVIATLAQDFAAVIIPDHPNIPHSSAPKTVEVNYKKIVRADSAYVCKARLVEAQIQPPPIRDPPRWVVEFTIETLSGQLCAHARVTYDRENFKKSMPIWARVQQNEIAKICKEKNLDRIDIPERSDDPAMEELPVAVWDWVSMRTR
ncbi:hypothetical protein P152DRAFT_228471 [Eremomyces bilateralis CBS 781.70]|uniref:Thioesterase/thiol ester dehydrase-isomerase n=1 Tax=Eremomyces bilateralis CBS 781.70 TaxID=1392243 RepID=A0A6G1FRB7_9PEZI|nr:uncharacterized protein P152DRAFT_228471 [Eremomyces bilateralis CBS 781.70]KAF1808260.1 hypothetical protein P152DRAFT_228471 [Eremomyces bilateralis CBS 781.70]